MSRLQSGRLNVACPLSSDWLRFSPPPGCLVQPGGQVCRHGQGAHHPPHAADGRPVRHLQSCHRPALQHIQHLRTRGEYSPYGPLCPARFDDLIHAHACPPSPCAHGCLWQINSLGWLRIFHWKIFTKHDKNYAMGKHTVYFLFYLKGHKKSHNIPVSIWNRYTFIHALIDLF